ncbi:MAG: DUF748 domain-containing protein [Candidatus Binataceae bacterium]|nr:DUF748 domain-containing protein [Candidatus Binataceae bacterium]
MRRILLVAGGVAGLLVVIAATVVGYAVINLNSIIAANRERILARASDALGRPVAAQAIKASLGWGVAIDLRGVTIADDPAFAPTPFVTAGDVLLKVKFLPLLDKQLRVTELLLKHPQGSIIRAADGRLNVSTLARHADKSSPIGEPPGSLSGGIGGPSGTPMESAAARDASAAADRASRLGAISIRTFTIEDGTVQFSDRQAGGPPVTIDALNLRIDDFTFAAPFTVKLTMAAFGAQNNFALSGTVGPIVTQGTIDLDALALDLTLAVGPLTLAQLASLPALARALPPAVVLSDAVTLTAKVAGTIDHPRFDARGDLTANRVAWPPRFDKPAGVPLKLTASGAYTGGTIVVRQAEITLADLKATLTDIAIAGRELHARVDTNDFALAPLAALIPAAARFNPTGSAAVHSAIAVTGAKPALHGTVTLTGVTLALPTGKAPPLSNLSGTIRVAGNRASTGPLTFKLGSGNARLEANASSLEPLAATYQFNVDKLVLAELIPRRPANGDEHLLGVTAAGHLGRDHGQLAAATRASAASGLIANVPFNNLALDAGYAGSQVTLNALSLEAFAGSINATGVATVGALPSFDLTLNTRNVDLRQALEAQQAKAATTIRGRLTSTLELAGHGKTFAEIKPRLHGSGRAELSNATLVGVNVVAQALKKVANLPGIDALMPAAVIANHPELFQSPDTAIESASLTFLILAGRIDSNDIVVRSPDYSILAHGWFDFDQHLDLVAKILLSRPFSDELVAARRNDAFLTNGAGQIEIPLRIAGQLPKPAVVPDLGNLAQRAAGHAVENKLGDLLQKKGLGGLLGGALGGRNRGGGPGGNGSGGGIANPFKGLFH